jgi:hypothetical protein
VAAELGLSVETMRKWHSRFTESGPTGLADAPRPGRRKADLVLTGAERDQLAPWARRAKTSQVQSLRAKIVLTCAEGRENKAVARELRTTEHNVARRRGRFIEGWLGGLYDLRAQRQRLAGLPRRATAPTLTDALKAGILPDYDACGRYRIRSGAAPV